MERVLVSVYPILAYSVIAWGLVALVGPYAAPFYLAAVGAVFLRVYALPMPSSFRFPIADSRVAAGIAPFFKARPDAARTYAISQGTWRPPPPALVGGRVRSRLTPAPQHAARLSVFGRAGYVLDGLDVAILMAFFAYAPSVAYVLLNWGGLRENLTQATDLFALVAIPLFAVWHLAPRGLLWWTGRARRRHPARRGAHAASSLVSTLRCLLAPLRQASRMRTCAGSATGTWC